MPTRTLESELKSLVFAYYVFTKRAHNPSADKIKNDFVRALNCRYSDQEGKNLHRGLLIGRSVDSFTVFFLRSKRMKWDDTFDERINRICQGTTPLTNDPTIKNDLHRVRKLRNELFHKADRKLTRGEMNDLVFKSVRSVLQLINDF